MFWKDEWLGEVIRDNVQHLIMKFTKHNVEIVFTMVYTRCDALERLELWEELHMIAHDFALPWLVGGDFNVIKCKRKGRGLRLYPC